MFTRTRVPSAVICACALAACSAGGGRDVTGAAGTIGGAGVGAGTAGTAAAAGTTGAAGTSGAAGTAAAAGTSGAAGIGPSLDAGGADGPSKDAQLAADAAASGCAAPAVICDDFEKYAAGTSNLAPDWITYTYSGTVRVDATRPRAGKQSLHLNTQAGARRYADLIRYRRGQALLPQRHFGRMMVWLTAVPPSAHWNLNMSSGPMVGAPDEQVKLLEGGMFGKLMSNYAQRVVPSVGGQPLMRGGGPENGDPGSDADCAVAATTQTIAAGRWVCWEWEFDGTADTARLWIDGQPMNEIDAIGSGKQCQGPGFMGRKMMPNYRWESPQVFDKLMIGWEQYQDTPAQELWIDDVVVSSARVGCPPP
jgi:hypothetical protein